MTNSILKQTILSATGSLCVKGLALVLTPITLYFLSPDKFGLFALCNSFITILSLIFACGFRQVFWVEYVHAEQTEKHSVINDVIIMYLAFSVPLLALLWVFLPQVNNFIFMGQATPLLLYLSLANCFFTFFAELVQQVALYQQKSKLFLALNIMSMLITVLSSLIFLWQGYGVAGLLCAQILGILFVCIGGLYAYLEQRMQQHFGIKRLAHIYTRYFFGGLAVMPSLLAMWVISASTRWVLAYRGNLKLVGIYSLVEMVATLFQILILRPLNTVYAPAMVAKFLRAHTAQEIAQKDAENRKVMRASMLGLGTLSFVGFYLLLPLAFYILPVSYHAAIEFALPMAFSQIFIMGTVFACCFIQFKQKTLAMSLMLTAAIVVNAAISWHYVPLQGVQGAFVGLIISSFCYFVMSLGYNKYMHTL